MGKPVRLLLIGGLALLLVAALVISGRVAQSPAANAVPSQNHADGVENISADRVDPSAGRDGDGHGLDHDVADGTSEVSPDSQAVVTADLAAMVSSPDTEIQDHAQGHGRAVPVKGDADPTTGVSNPSDKNDAAVAGPEGAPTPDVLEVLAEGKLPAGHGQPARQVTVQRWNGLKPLVRVVESADGQRTFAVASHVLVRVQPGVESADLERLALAAGALGVQQIGRGHFFTVAVDPVNIIDYDRVRDALSQAAETVVYTEPDYLQWKMGFPDDADFAELWGLHNTGQTGGTADADIDAPEAWDISTGSEDVIVGVIDSGIDINHPDLADNIWVNPGESGVDGSGNAKATNGIDDDGNGYIDDVHGWDFVEDDNIPNDETGHGTHVAGTIGGIGNNGSGVAGVCWSVRLAALRFLDESGFGSTVGAIESVEYATAMGFPITNNSWGGGPSNSALEDAIADSNHVFVAAAGNSGTDNDVDAHYPSSYTHENIISVAASNHFDLKAGFSNYGTTDVDLAAPGVDIYSARAGGGYVSQEGTSMASPQVAGAVALLLSVKPDATIAQLKDAILDGVDEKSALSTFVATGGRLNVFNALKDLIDGLASASLTVLTDGTAGSSGDGDEWIEPGERIALTYDIFNARATDIEDVTVNVGTTGGVLNVAVNDLVAGTIAAESYVTGPTFLLDVATPPAFPHRETLTLTFTDGDDEQWVEEHAIIIESPIQISGTVIELTGGAAISGATVTYAQPGGLSPESVVTGVDGSYQFEFSGTHCEIYASKAGYQDSDPQVVSLTGSSQFIELELGRPQIVINPDEVVQWLGLGDSVVVPVEVENDGDLPLSVRIAGFDPISYSFDEDDVAEWQDISLPANRLEDISDADDAYEQITLPFSFPFYDNTIDQFYISTNGFICTIPFGSSFFNDSLSLVPGHVIAPFWDDLNPAARGDIYWQDFGDHVIIQWNDVERFYLSADPVGSLTFQLALYVDGTIQFRYEDLNDVVNECTVGIAHETKGAVDIVVNGNYLSSDRSFTWILEAWMAPELDADEVLPLAAADLNIALDTTGLDHGTYNGTVFLEHNDPSEPSPLAVAVQLNIPENARSILLMLDSAVDVTIDPSDRAIYSQPSSTQHDFSLLDITQDHELDVTSPLGPTSTN